MQIRDAAVTFVPDEGTWILTGKAEPGGAIYADKNQVGANKLVYETTFEARWTPDVITGTYTTPRCKFDVRLTRK